MNSRQTVLAIGDSQLYYCSTLGYSCSLGTVTQVKLVFQREIYLLLLRKSLVEYNLHKIQLQWQKSLAKAIKENEIQQKSVPLGQPGGQLFGECI